MFEGKRWYIKSLFQNSMLFKYSNKFLNVLKKRSLGLAKNTLISLFIPPSLLRKHVLALVKCFKKVAIKA